MSTAVSVALCTHNGARFIGEQVQSILDQTQPPSEIVLSDDASTDDTVGVATSIISEYNDANPDATVAFRVLRNEAPLGVTRNFEQAILACTSEFVVLSDQDDRWHRNRIERSLQAFESNPRLSLVHSDATLVDASGASLDDSLFAAYDVSPRVISLIHSGNAFDVLARRTIVTGATVMLRRSFAERCAPFPVSWVHDEWLAIVAAMFGELDVIEERLVDYRQHGANEIGAGSLGFFGKLRRMLQPGVERNRRLLARASELADRIGSMPGVDAKFVAEASEKLEHERVRSALRPQRLSRVVPVIRELRTGRYSRYGRGVADAVRDVLQPL